MGLVKAKKYEFTDPMRCGHCTNVAPMKKGSTYSTVHTKFDEHTGNDWDEGEIYKILECPSCEKVILQKEYYHDLLDGDQLPPDEILYPSSNVLPIGLPDSIAKGFNAALKVKPIDANAFGVLIGRVLEMVCEDRKAKGRDLNARLEDLATRGEIPNNLVGVANGLRNLRNVGAHAFIGELTPRAVPILNSLAIAILEYVYSAPRLAKIAQEQLAMLKTTKRS